MNATTVIIIAGYGSGIPKNNKNLLNPIPNNITPIGIAIIKYNVVVLI